MELIKLLNKSEQYYFLGIKGTGMAGLALVMHDLGYKVMGSDIEKYTFTQEPLLNAGIEVLNFAPENIKTGMTIIKGNAFKEDNVEVAKALELNVPMQSYPDTLGMLLGDYTSIGIAGAHGKTSTTGLMAHVLGGVDTTSFLVGDGTGKGIPDSKFFVYEADEYRRHFLAYHPDYLVMTNIDFDHPDYFKDINDVASAFQTAASQVKKGLFVWGDDANLQKISVTIPKYTYGFNDTDDYQVSNITKNPEGSKFNVSYKGTDLGQFAIHLFGDHNILNATAVVGVAHQEGLNLETVREELLTYAGTKRRFAEKDFGDVVVIDDYAHHPTEIKVTLEAARQKFPDRKVVAVFQPHTYSRTLKFADQFAEILKQADKVYLTPIFGSARENAGDISSEILAKKISPETEVITKENIADLTVNHNSVMVFMGAGDIQKYEDLYEQLL